MRRMTFAAPSGPASAESAAETAAMTERENLLNLTPADAERRLASAMSELGQPSYRVGQVLRRLSESARHVRCHLAQT